MVLAGDKDNFNGWFLFTLCLTIAETSVEDKNAGISREEISESHASINEPLGANKKPSGISETGKKCLRRFLQDILTVNIALGIITELLIKCRKWGRERLQEYRRKRK